MNSENPPLARACACTCREMDYLPWTLPVADPEAIQDTLHADQFSAPGRFPIFRPAPFHGGNATLNLAGDAKHEAFISPSIGGGSRFAFRLRSLQ